jgi:hypothetical protein
VITLNSAADAEPMMLMTGGDLLIAIGFFNYLDMQMVLDYANQHKRRSSW